MGTSTRNLLLTLAAGVVAFVVARLVRRFVPSLAGVDTGPWSTTLSYVATSYGVVVGFSILLLFSQFAEARSAVGDEATSIGTAFDQAALFPDSAPGIQQALICYGRAVPTYDWPALRDGAGAPEVDRAYDDLVLSLGEGDQPTTGALHSATATNLANQIGAISTARETRLVAAETTFPALMWALLFGGGAFVLVMIFVVTMPARPGTQAALVALSTVFTIVLLLIVVALSRPFVEGEGRLSPKLIEQTTASMEAAAPAGVGGPCDTDPGT